MPNLTRYDPFSDFDDMFKGFFLRPVRLGDAQAKYKDGVLELVLPKKATARQRQITVG